MRGFRLRLSLLPTRLLVAREKKTSGTQSNDWTENAQMLSMRREPIHIT